MTRLEQAMLAAEERKVASLDDRTSGLRVGDEYQQRAVFLGFDVDYHELVETQERVGFYFCKLTPNIGLRPLFSTAWTDGFLTGLLHASLPPAEDSELH